MLFHLEISIPKYSPINTVSVLQSSVLNMFPSYLLPPTHITFHILLNYSILYICSVSSIYFHWFLCFPVFSNVTLSYLKAEGSSVIFMSPSLLILAQKVSSKTWSFSYNWAFPNVSWGLSEESELLQLSPSYGPASHMILPL